MITDGWPSDVEGSLSPLTAEHLAHLGFPALLPTPPFTVGRELCVDPLNYPGFVGYAQKGLLLPVHKAILRYATAA